MTNSLDNLTDDQIALIATLVIVLAVTFGALFTALVLKAF